MTTFSTFATATYANGNIVVVQSAENMIPGLPIMFAGNTFGNLTANATYYIGNITFGFPTSNITLTSLPGGAIYAIGNGSGNMVASFSQGGQQIIPTVPPGEPLNVAFDAINVNFDQIFAAGPVGSNIQIDENTIYTINTNGNLVLNPNGIGNVIANAHVIPDRDRVRNLGAPALRWNSIYAQNIVGNIAGNIVAGGSNGQIQFNNNGILAGANGFTYNNSTNAVSIVGTITAGNVLTPGIVSSVGGIYGDIYTTLIDSGDSSAILVISDMDLLGDLSVNQSLDVGGRISATGNITGSYFFGNGSQLTGITADNVNADDLIGNTLSGNVLYSSLVTVGNLANLSVVGNTTAGNVSAVGNISATYFFGNGSQLTGIDATSIQNGNSNVRVAANANVTVGVSGVSNVAVFTPNGVNVTGSVSATGNVTGGNVLFGSGIVSGTGNIYANKIFANIQGNIDAAGNLYEIQFNTTGDQLGANSNFTYDFANNVLTVNGGNIVGANILTGGNVSAVGNVHGNWFIGNVNATVISATGNISANYYFGNGSQLTGVAASSVDANNLIGNTLSSNVIFSSLTTVGNLVDLSVVGTTTTGNLATAGYISASGNIISNSNITGSNLLTSGTVSAVSNVTGGNVLTGGTVSAAGTVQGGNIVTAGFVSATGNVTGANVNTLTVWSSSDLNLQPVGNVALANRYITGVRYPSADQDAASKIYVDNLVSTAISYHEAVVAATTTTLATATGGTVTYTQPNGVSNGIGATLTTTGSFNLIDTANVQTAGTRILVKNEANATHNGVYIWSNTTAITRSSDADTAGVGNAFALGLNDYFFVTNGNVNLGTAWIVDAPTGTITFGSSNISFAQFSQSQVYTANTSAGLSLTGTVFSAKVDNNTTAFDGSGNIAVKAGANLTTPNIGAATGTSLSVTGNVEGGNIVVGNKIIPAVGNVNVANVNISNVLDPVQAQDAATKFYVDSAVGSASGNVLGNLINMGSNTQGQLVSNAVTLTTTTKVTDGIALLNQILGKLVPPSPPAFPAGQTLSITSINAYRMANIVQVNNTANSLTVAAGTTVNNVRRAATYVTNTITTAGPGDSGTITAFRNGTGVGNTTFNPGATPSANGTYGGNLVITNNFDYNSANANITPGFWYVFSAAVSGSTAPAGWNDLLIIDSAAGNTNVLSWYYDNSSPSTPSFSSTTMVESANTLSYSSTIPHYTSSTQFTIGTTVANVSGNMYPTSNVLASGVSGGSFAAPGSVNYNASNIGSNILNSFQSASFTTTVNVTTGFGGSSTGPQITVNNSYSTGTLTLTTALGNTVLRKTGNSTAIDEGNIVVTSVGTGSGNAVRIVNPGTGNTPVYTANAATFNSQSSTLQTYDATVVGTNSQGTLKHDQTNYATGYLPVGPDLSAGRTGTQYFTFKFVRTNVSKFDITYAGNVAGMWVALPGSVIDSTSGANGWINMATSYAGAGVPGANVGAGGNGSDGCALGGIVQVNTTVASTNRTCTFGTVSSSSTSSNEIYVRVALTSGQSVTALAINTASN